ncbi:MAG TPA: FIST N-terminal domain-containing protein, partial [Polyangiaceae bacterium]|nr:FIST N-terminal domain-containing protein [Polyangiaceae bacterium]
PDVPVIGCSAQGVMGSGRVREDGFASGALALGGDSIVVRHGMVSDITTDTASKGASLGRALRDGLDGPPRVVVLNYDAVSGVDIEAFLDGLFAEVGCPIVGGGAAHSYSFEELVNTHQYYGNTAASGAAVACSISGPFAIEVDACHGCSPVGVEVTVTRAQENVLIELDGRRAVDLWREICGDQFAERTALAIGIPVEHAGAEHAYRVRAPYQFEPSTGGVILGCSIPVGTRVMLHHRSTQDVLDGAMRMGQALSARLRGRRVRAVLGVECGSRTRPFLGDEDTLRENLELQAAIGQDAAWLGMMAWGEIFPILGRPTFHNYSYPLLAFTD